MNFDLSVSTSANYVALTKNITILRVYTKSWEYSLDGILNDILVSNLLSKYRLITYVIKLINSVGPRSSLI